MSNLVNWPGDTQTDDDGTGSTGTVWNEIWSDAARDSINDQIASAGNPAIKPKTIIDEVVTARGTLASLDARLDVSMNDDGTMKPIAGQASEAQLVSFAAGNWIQDDDFLIWPGGDAVAPAGWTLAGAGGTIVRCGSGLADTNTKVGLYCPKVTRAAADVTLSQSLLNATSYAARGACLVGRKFAYGCWVRSAVANMARLRMYEGGAGVDSVTAYHTGVAGWEFLSAVHTVTAGASQLTLMLEVKNSAGDSYFSGATALPGQVALTDWTPCPRVYGTLVATLYGTQTVADNRMHYRPGRPGLIRDVQLELLTGPVGADLICDIDVWDGAVFATPYTAGNRPRIAAGTARGGAQPDPAVADYKYQCLAGSSGAVQPAGSIVRLNVDQVGGAGTEGTDLYGMIRVMQYARPQEGLLDYADGAA